MSDEFHARGPQTPLILAQPGTIGLKYPWHETSRCRPRERGDPVNADRAGASGFATNALEYWVPAFAGTTAESHRFTCSKAGTPRRDSTGQFEQVALGFRFRGNER